MAESGGGGGAGAVPASLLSQASTYLVAGTLYCLSSIGLFLVNKFVIDVVPLPFALMLLQNGVTVLFVLLAAYHKNDRKVLETTWADVRNWLVVVVIFVAILYSSFRAMGYLSVATMVVLRNLNSLSVAAVDRLWLKTHLPLKRIVALCVIIVGAYVYAYWDLEFNPAGYGWVFVNLASMAAYTIVTKYIGSKYKFSAEQMSLMNNAVSLPVLVFFMVLFGELSELGATASSLSLFNWTAVLASALLGYAISVTSFHATKVFSATAFIALNNLNKIPIVFLGFVLFSAKLSMQSFVGLCISLVGGFWFALLGISPAKPGAAAPAPSASTGPNTGSALPGKPNDVEAGSTRSGSAAP